MPSISDHLKVDVRHVGQSVEFHIAGELDLATAPFLREQLHQAVTSGETDPLVLDISGLSYVDSTGLSLFIATKKRAEREGREFRFTRPTADFLRLIEVTGLTAFFGLEQPGPGRSPG